MKRWQIWLGLICLACSSIAPLQAQALYRCGNSYQDKPCAPGESGKVIKKDISRSDGAANALDAQCARRGEAAQKIVWAREAGALEAQQLEKARNEDERELIAQVYSQRTTGPEMKRIVEAKCIKDKQLAQNGQNGNSAANSGANASAKSGPPKKAPAAEAEGTVSDDSERKAAASAAEKKKAQCEQLRQSIQDNISQQRKGGDPSEMDALNQRRRELNSKFSKADC